MPALSITSFNIVCATLGGFIALFGLVSFLIKEKFYLSETLISTIAGVIFSPHVTNLIRPLEYALGNQETLAAITLSFSRLVLGIQLFIAGVQLPSKYLQREWKSLAYLLGPGMAVMWLFTSLIVWALVPNINLLFAMAVAACVTPTDPVLANNIVKGKFADKNIPVELQHIIIAESGANDGLGYPFLFLPLLLIKYFMANDFGSYGKAGEAIGIWFYDIWVYQILLGLVYGFVVGWVAKELLHWAEQRKYVDRESFLVFAIALALFILGTAGLFGSDDVLACFIAGNSFTWDDWFRVETKDDSLQPTIDLLLNVAYFLWLGAVCPWASFAHNSVIPLYRLVPLGLLVLLFRRPPIVLLLHKQVRQIENLRHASFVGYFGPIGVSALFYLNLTLDWLALNVREEGHESADAARLAEIMTVVVWFLVVCSVFVHGLSIPLGKLGLAIPRTLSRARSDKSEPHFSFRRSNPTLPRTAAEGIFVTRPGTPSGQDFVPLQDRPPATNRVQNTRSPVLGGVDSPASLDNQTQSQAFHSASGSHVVSLENSRPQSPVSEVDMTDMHRSIRFPDEIRADKVQSPPWTQASSARAAKTSDGKDTDIERVTLN